MLAKLGLTFLSIGLAFQLAVSSPSDNFPKECGTMPVVHSNYTPVGKNFQLPKNNMTIYETGQLNSTRILIVIYDIFGYHPNTKQVADTVGLLGGFRVVMPDFYRGVPWDENNFPPKEWKDLVNWVEEHGNWNKSMRRDIMNVIEYYKDKTPQNESQQQFGMFGFCWGGGISLEAGSELTNYIKAVGLVHPSFVDTAEAAKRIKTPIIVLPSQNEPDYIEFFKTASTRLGPGKIENVRFDDMFHGFASARGDLANPIVKERVEQVISMLNNFFNRHLKK